MPYRVVDHPGFTQDLETLGPKDGRLELLVTTLKAALSRNPYVGREHVQSGIWRIRGNPERAMPIVFYYSVDKEQVTILGAVAMKM